MSCLVLETFFFFLDLHKMIEFWYLKKGNYCSRKFEEFSKMVQIAKLMKSKTTPLLIRFPTEDHQLAVSVVS